MNEKVYMDFELDQLFHLTNSLIKDDASSQFVYNREKDFPPPLPDENLSNILTKLDNELDVSKTSSKILGTNERKKYVNSEHVQYMRSNGFSESIETNPSRPATQPALTKSQKRVRNVDTFRPRSPTEMSKSFVKPLDDRTPSSPDKESQMSCKHSLQASDNDDSSVKSLDTFDCRLNALKDKMHKDPAKELKILMSNSDFKKNLQRFSYMDEVALLLNDQALSKEQLKDEFLVEILSIALVETHQQAYTKQVLEKEKERLETEIMATQEAEEDEERRRRDRVAKHADKTLLMRHKLQEMNDEKMKDFSEKEAARAVRIKKLKKSKKVAHLRALSPTNEIKASVAEHQARRREFLESREKEIRDRFAERLKKHILLSQAQGEQQRQQIQARQEWKIRNTTKALRISSDQKEKFRVKSAEALQQKDERSERLREREKLAYQEKIEALRRKEELKAFRARERTRLKEEDRIFRQEVVDLRQAQLDELARIRREVGFNRPNTVRDIYRERYTQKAPPLPNNTEGPTGYFLPKNNKGPVFRPAMLARSAEDDCQGVSQLESFLLQKELSPPGSPLARTQSLRNIFSARSSSPGTPLSTSSKSGTPASNMFSPYPQLSPKGRKSAYSSPIHSKPASPKSRPESPIVTLELPDRETEAQTPVLPSVTSPTKPSSVMTTLLKPKDAPPMQSKNERLVRYLLQPKGDGNRPSTADSKARSPL